MDEFREFHANLNVGDRVIERGESGMKGETGTIVEMESGKCIKWDTKFEEGSGMVTSVTLGARLIPEENKVITHSHEV